MYTFNPIKDLMSVIFSPRCISCGRALIGDERQLCVDCLCHIPFTGFAQIPDNALELLLTGVIPHVKATALMYYQKNEPAQRVIHDIKYHGNIQLARRFGRLLGTSMSDSHRFDDIDVIVPVPLHFIRHFQRGYNQSLMISQGLAETFSRPINPWLLFRTRYTITQTQQMHAARADNVKGAFKVFFPSKLKGKHLLLVDDVVTTGSTVKACYEALKAIEGVRVSVATLSYAIK